MYKTKIPINTVKLFRNEFSIRRRLLSDDVFSRTIEEINGIFFMLSPFSFFYDVLNQLNYSFAITSY